MIEVKIMSNKVGIYVFHLKFESFELIKSANVASMNIIDVQWPSFDKSEFILAQRFGHPNHTLMWNLQ